MITGEPNPSPAPTGLQAWIKLLRPVQWTKSAFCFIGPVFYLADHWGRVNEHVIIHSALLCAAVFALVSSACYIFNDIADAPRDRMHPRKARRPIASGAIHPRSALLMALVLTLVAAALLLPLAPTARWWVGLGALAYALNVVAYSLILKHIIIADVICLSAGFVLRVVAGCGAIMIFPSTWLLNVTLFLAMFLAFGKRLGERRTLGDDAGKARGVQFAYTDDLLRMSVVVTGVATLFTYANYVQSREFKFASVGKNLGLQDGSINLLWLTIVPAIYALLRCIVQVERGRYDDPTELAVRDRPFQLACLAFAALTGLALWASGAK
jgi:4-hydroxybenzoate polyprenyltransferase